MFTSRAEFRLLLRADNADQRLTGRGIEIGCVGERRRSAFESKMDLLKAAETVLVEASFTPRQVAELGVSISQDGVRRTAFDLLAYPDVSVDMVSQLCPAFEMFDLPTRTQIGIEALYAQYVARQTEDVLTLQREEQHRIPDDFDYDDIAGLSSELQSKLQRLRPVSIAQAKKIEGMTPAALLVILARLRRPSSRRAV
jgi:tRNA uridine 5-carboxymethylaminomethyl modification enzyme